MHISSGFFMGKIPNDRNRHPGYFGVGVPFDQNMQQFDIPVNIQQNFIIKNQTVLLLREIQKDL